MKVFGETGKIGAVLVMVEWWVAAFGSNLRKIKIIKTKVMTPPWTASKSYTALLMTGLEENGGLTKEYIGGLGKANIAPRIPTSQQFNWRWMENTGEELMTHLQINCDLNALTWREEKKRNGMSSDKPIGANGKLLNLTSLKVITNGSLCTRLELRGNNTVAMTRAWTDWKSGLCLRRQSPAKHVSDIL